MERKSADEEAELPPVPVRIDESDVSRAFAASDPSRNHAAIVFDLGCFVRLFTKSFATPLHDPGGNFAVPTMDGTAVFHDFVDLKLIKNGSSMESHRSRPHKVPRRGVL